MPRIRPSWSSFQIFIVSLSWSLAGWGQCPGWGLLVIFVVSLIHQVSQVHDPWQDGDNAHGGDEAETILDWDQISFCCLTYASGWWSWGQCAGWWRGWGLLEIVIVCCFIHRPFAGRGHWWRRWWWWGLEIAIKQIYVCLIALLEIALLDQDSSGLITSACPSEEAMIFFSPFFIAWISGHVNAGPPGSPNRGDCDPGAQFFGVCVWGGCFSLWYSSRPQGTKSALSLMRCGCTHFFRSLLQLFYQIFRMMKEPWPAGYPECHDDFEKVARTVLIFFSCLLVLSFYDFPDSAGQRRIIYGGDVHGGLQQFYSCSRLLCLCVGVSVWCKFHWNARGLQQVPSDVELVQAGCFQSVRAWFHWCIHEIVYEKLQDQVNCFDGPSDEVLFRFQFHAYMAGKSLACAGWCWITSVSTQGLKLADCFATVSLKSPSITKPRNPGQEGWFSSELRRCQCLGCWTFHGSNLSSVKLISAFFCLREFSIFDQKFSTPKFPIFQCPFPGTRNHAGFLRLGGQT